MRFIRSLLKQFVFWMLLFAFSRLVFYVYYWNVMVIENIDISEVLLSFWHAIPLDIATASYLIAFPTLLLFVQTIWNKKWLNTVNLIYTFIIIIIYFLITTAELGIYDEWKTKLHYKALHYISNPDEIYNSSDTTVFFLLLTILTVKIFIGIYIFKRFIYEKIEKPKRSLLFSTVIIVVSSIMVFLGIRGGISEIPITQSKSYFSKHNFVNLASVNSGYSLLISTIENYKFKDENPFGFYDLKIAKNRVQELHTVENDTTTKILKTNRPNIVILILESWSADLIESLGGRSGITPEFRKLEKQGLLFTELYASGNRSEQAMTSIFAGFPSTPITAISHTLEKVIKLPSLTKTLKKEGYSTSYYFGGELMYGGIKSFISINGFDVIREMKDFDKNLPRGKLGIHDEFMLDEQLSDLNSQKEPFFSALFTVSTHSPYDQPMDDVINWAKSKNQKGYLNSAYYTDKCLGDYFEKAKQQPWYSNTLFIIVADHSHDTYKHWPIYKKEYRKIPLLFFGDVIKDEFKGKQISRISSQTDIAGTLLSQLEINADEFFWSRNLLNPTTSEFAYYESNDGVGWVSKGGSFVYSNTLGDVMEKDIDLPIQDSVIMDGKSYLQVLFQEFMDY